MKVRKMQKELLSNNTKELTRFIKTEFMEPDKENISKLRNNINTLKAIDIDVKDLLIAKMDYIKSDYETQGQIYVVFSIMFVLMGLLAELIFNDDSPVPYIIIILVAVLALLVALLAYLLIKQKKRISVADFFKSFLIELKNR